VLDAEDSAVYINDAADMDENKLAEAFTAVFEELFDADVKILDRKKRFIPESSTAITARGGRFLLLRQHRA